MHWVHLFGSAIVAEQAAEQAPGATIELITLVIN
jgi:hypothetical protein